ncbi:MAG: hypothetical protein Q7R47_02525, partial [Candidatus Diapherotrites archaeon]|nr:hypothetical protein [Candidatus Diapherotrites archaeon]
NPGSSLQCVQCVQKIDEGLCALSASLCGSGHPYADYNARYSVSGLPQGDLNATIDPKQAKDVDGKGINQCTLHDKDNIICAIQTHPLYFLVEYWAWQD